MYVFEYFWVDYIIPSHLSWYLLQLLNITILLLQYMNQPFNLLRDTVYGWTCWLVAGIVHFFQCLFLRFIASNSPSPRNGQTVKLQPPGQFCPIWVGVELLKLWGKFMSKLWYATILNQQY